MRLIFAIFGVAIALCLFGAQPSSAHEFPWCAQYEGQSGAGRGCGYVSWQQCQAAIGGIGGFCLPNPGFRGFVEAPYSRHRR